MFQSLLIQCLCCKEFFKAHHNHLNAWTLQKEGSERYMDTDNKVMCALYVAVTSNKLSPTQRMVAEALTGQGLNVDTASVYSHTKSKEDAPRQRMYFFCKQHNSLFINFSHSHAL